MISNLMKLVLLFLLGTFACAKIVDCSEYNKFVGFVEAS